MMTAPVEFTYRREGSRSFLETLEAVESAVRSRGFSIVRKHDLQATLAAKGFIIQPLVILDVVLGADDAHPCKLHVYAEGDCVWVTAIRPTILWSVIERDPTRPADEAEQSVVELVDEAVG